MVRPRNSTKKQTKQNGETERFTPGKEDGHEGKSVERLHTENTQSNPPKIPKVILKKEGSQWKTYENFTGEKPFLLSYEKVSRVENRN